MNEIRLRRTLSLFLSLFFVFGSFAPQAFSATPAVSNFPAPQTFPTPDSHARIPLLEYHHFGPKEDRWTRSYDHFRKDLEWLYNNDYRSVSMADFTAGNFSLSPGMKPVVFTFDDGLDSQIQLDKDGKVLPDTAVGIMDNFLKVHPDFGSASVFYVNGNFFSASPDRVRVVQYLLTTGREVQNHTLNHADLSKSSTTEIEKQMGWFDPYFRKELYARGGEWMTSLNPGLSLAYPFGGVPKTTDGMDVVKKYTKYALLVGADPAYPPGNLKFDAYHIPRIQAIDDEWRRWFRRSPGSVAREEGKDRGEVFVPYRVPGTVSNVSVAPVINASEAVSSPLPPPAPPKVYPFDACRDPLAQQFIHYKESGALERTRLASDPMNFMHVGARMIQRYLRETYAFSQVRAIYFTSSTAAGETGKKLVERLKKSGGNAVVFDIKETPGYLSFVTQPDGKEHKGKIENLRSYVSWLQTQGIYVIARIVVFKDEMAARQHPDWAIQDVSGGVWRDNKGVSWLDPSNQDAQNYILDLAKKVAAAGVDEVQYDYVRFPTEGALDRMRFRHYDGKGPKWEVIRDFVRRSRQELLPYAVSLSADIFGIVGWNNGYDAKSTGQKIECLAPYLDAIYPMGYPSHFGPGFGGHKNPADEPYFFTKTTTGYFVKFAEGTHTQIRPWLQAFTYRVTIPYNAKYISEQVRGTKDAGGVGYSLWNAGNAYDVAWPALGAF